MVSIRQVSHLWPTGAKIRIVQRFFPNQNTGYEFQSLAGVKAVGKPAISTFC